MAGQVQVLLKEDVDHLGYKGDVVEVRKGYWRNFLRPQGKATTVNRGMLTDLMAKMERRRLAEAESTEEAKELRDMLARTSVTVAANASPQGKLYGSVSPEEISRALEAVRRLRLDPAKIVLDEPIKAVGTYMVPVALFGGIRAELSVTVEAREVAAEEEPPAAEAAAESTEVEPEAAADDAADDAGQVEASADDADA